jgi:hypothetical protein
MTDRSSTLIALRINNAEQLKEASTEPTPNTKIYLTFGRTSAWSNEAAPPSANSSVASELEIWQYMIGGKNITGADIAHVIPRNDWAANTIYVAYDHMDADLHNTARPFYCVNSNYSVYKCLGNNSNSSSNSNTLGANSTVEPTSVNPNTVIETSDGYLWKYMYSVSDSDQLRFTTAEWVPVKTIPADDSSVQWQVQSGADDGGINFIEVTDGGSGYTNGSNITVTVSGDGSSATGTATLNTTTNTVNSISVTNPGTGYRYGSVVIAGGAGTGALARPIISPPGGHGSDPLYELGGKNLLLNPRLVADEEDILETSNDFRQISLVKDPQLRDTTTPAQNTAFLQAHTIITTGEGDYIVDETVYQGASLADATFSATILKWDSTNASALVINTIGTATSDGLIGANSAVIRFITSSTEGNFEKDSGRILYIDNLVPITRAADQTEDFKIVLKF